MTLCNLDIEDATFESNLATEKGGAIYYDYARPKFGTNLTYTNNSAQYGSNIGSYAVKITKKENPSNYMTINNLGSGIAYENTLEFAVRDYDNQIMNLNNENQIFITSLNQNEAQVSGFNSGKIIYHLSKFSNFIIAALKNGISTFDNLIVTSEPGSKRIMISASSKAISNTKISEVFGSQISDNLIELDFRYCKPGEQVSGSI